MDTSATLDADDRRIVNALQVDGRASAARLAEALGLAERTVVRRLNRLFDTDTVRVVLSRASAPETDSVTIIIRVRVLRGKVLDIAKMLARRDDIQFVDIMQGGHEIVASSTTASAPRAQILLNGLASSRDIVEITSHTGLHLYADPTTWKLGTLSPAEETALQPSQVHDGPDWSADDPAVRLILAGNARVPLADLSRRSSIPLSTLRRRVQALNANGLLRAVTLVDREALALQIDANINLTVPPAYIDEVGRALAATPGVHGAAATTGTPNMFVAYYCADLPALHRFTVETLGALKVAAAEVNLVGTPVKRAGTFLTGPAAI